MSVTHYTLPSILTLAIAACAPGDDGKDDGAPSAPIGFELAMAEDADEAEAPSQSVVDLTPQQLREKLTAGNVRVIDVRRDDEVAEGMIPGAEHVELDAFDPAALDLSDGREVVLYCRSGRRSGIAAEALAAHTGMPTQHLAGGILAWKADDGATETP